MKNLMKVQKLRKQGQSIAQIVSATGLAKSTVYNYCKDSRAKTKPRNATKARMLTEIFNTGLPNSVKEAAMEKVLSL